MVEFVAIEDLCMKAIVVLTCRGNGCGLIQFSKENHITNSVWLLKI